MVTGKPIFNSFLAKQLVLKGHRIIDLQKNHKIANATVFFFEETEDLIKDMVELTKK
jgi:hypothetical protein